MQTVVKKCRSGHLSPRSDCSIQPCVESRSQKATWRLVLGSWLRTTAAHQHRDVHLYEEMHFCGGEQLVLRALLEHDWLSRIFLSAVPAVRGVPDVKPEASPQTDTKLPAVFQLETISDSASVEIYWF